MPQPFDCLNVQDKEDQKFKEDSNGDVCVRTCVTEGAFTPSGLTTGGLITRVALSTTGWVALPPSPLAGRNALAIQNDTPGAANTDDIILNFVSLVGVTDGYLIKATGGYFTDIDSSIIIFGRAVTGTPTITVMEIA